MNCGATLDVVELLQADENTVFFILDSHRPVDVYNIYSESQVRLLMSPDDEEEVPAFEDIFKDEVPIHKLQIDSSIVEELLIN